MDVPTTISPMSSEYYYPIIMLIMSLLAILNFISMSLDNKEKEVVINDMSSTKSPLTIANMITKDQLKSKNTLRANYLICFLIVRASVWSKSPYMFILYFEYHKFTIQEIGILYIIDSITAMIASPIVGILSDKYGRKLLSLLYNVTVILNLILRLTGQRNMAYIAQILTGIGSGIVNTSYESWVVCESEKILPDPIIKQRFLKKLFKK